MSKKKSKKVYQQPVAELSLWHKQLEFDGLIIAEVWSPIFGQCECITPFIAPIMSKLESDTTVQWPVVNIAKLEEEASKKNYEIPLLNKYLGWNKPKPLFLFIKRRTVWAELFDANPPLLIKLIDRYNKPEPEGGYTVATDIKAYNYHPEAFDAEDTRKSLTTRAAEHGGSGDEHKASANSDDLNPPAPLDMSDEERARLAAGGGKASRPRRHTEAAEKHGCAVQFIELPQLLTALHQVHAQGRTALIVGDRDGLADSFFGLQEVDILEAKKYLLQMTQEGKSAADLLEQQLRPLLVNSLRHGRVLYVRMTNSAVDFKTQFTGATTLPQEIFDPAAIQQEAVWKQVLRDADLHTGTTSGVFMPTFDADAQCQSFLAAQKSEAASASTSVMDGAPAPKRDAGDHARIRGFRTVVCSSFEFEDYEEYLRDALPLDKMGVIVIEPSAEQAAHGDHDAQDGRAVAAAAADSSSSGEEVKADA